MAKIGKRLKAAREGVNREKAYAVDEAVKDRQIKRQIIDAEAGRDAGHVDLQRIGFVAP